MPNLPQSLPLATLGRQGLPSNAPETSTREFIIASLHAGEFTGAATAKRTSWPADCMAGSRAAARWRSSRLCTGSSTRFG